MGGIRDQCWLPREVNLREANLADVIAFLVDTSRKLDPEKQGVNIVVVPGAATAVTTAGTDPVAGQTNALPAEPRITLNLRNKSELEVLKIVMDLAGLKARARGNFLLLVPRNAPDSELVTRSYSVLPTFSEKIKALAE